MLVVETTTKSHGFLMILGFEEDWGFGSEEDWPVIDGWQDI